MCWAYYMTSVDDGPLPVGSLQSRIQKNHAAYRKKLEAAALPGESIREVEERLLTEEKKTRSHRDFSARRTPAVAKKTMPYPLDGERQADCFVPSLSEVSARDSRSMMDVAVFRLSKAEKRAGQMTRHNLSDGYVEVTAGPYGMASVWDYDIVLLLTACLTDGMNRYREGKCEKPGRVIKPRVSDILKFCRRGDGSRQFKEVEGALDRLKGTIIKSVRESQPRNGKRSMREVESEGLIGHYRVTSRTHTGRVASVEIEVPNWLYREVTSATKPDILTVHPDYFLIKSGIGRFVYRLARRAAGKDDAKWAFKTIYERSGSTGTFDKFSENLRTVIARDALPEYSLVEEVGLSGPQLVMKRRSDKNELR